MAQLYGGESAFIQVDGYNLITSNPSGMDDETTIETQETTGLGDSAKTHAPTGLTGHTVTLSGLFFDDTTNRVHDALSGSTPTSAQSAVRLLCLGFGGDTIGQQFSGFQGAYTHGYKVIGNLPGLTRADVEITITGDRNRGTILQDLATKTADWDTNLTATSVDYVDDTSQQSVTITSNSQANPTVVTTPNLHGLTSGDLIKITGVSGSDIDINFAVSGALVATVTSTTTFTVPVNCTTSGGTGGIFVRADSSNGGVGYLQVGVTPGVAIGFTNFVLTIEDSADDSVWASLGAFADDVTAPFAERITVAGQVDQFLSVDGNVTGTGSLDVWVGFSRS